MEMTISKQQDYLGQVILNAEYIAEVPEEHRTTIICYAAVSQDGSLLKYVPPGTVSELLCRSAVRTTEEAVTMVPKRFQYCIVDIVIQQPSLFSKISIKSDKLINEVLKVHGHLLKYIEKDDLTPEACMYAVESHPSVLEYIPQHYINEGLCLRAVQKDPTSLQYVPTRFQTEEIVATAIEKDPETILFIKTDACEESLLKFIAKRARSR